MGEFSVDVKTHAGEIWMAGGQLPQIHGKGYTQIMVLTLWLWSQQVLSRFCNIFGRGWARR